MKTKNRTSETFTKQTCLFALVLCLQPAAHARRHINQAQGEVKQLEPDQSVERKIAGGESHAYQITLEPGQFMRVLVDQKGIDLTLALATPQGHAANATADVNLNRVDLESLSYEATISGEYRFTIRALGAATLTGTYQARLELRDAATAQDRQRITAERLLGEGYPLYQRGQAQTATEKLEQALLLWREVGDQYWEAYTLTYLGYAGITLSLSEKAIEYFEEARTIYRRLKDPGGEGNALNGLGAASRLLGRAEKAIEYYERSVQIRRETSNRYGEGSTLSNLGLAYGDLSRYEKAIEQYEQALRIAREVKDRALEGRALNGLGLAGVNLGHYEKAIEYYEQALTTSREVKSRTNEAVLLNNLGIAYEWLGRTEKAIEYYEQALGIQREIKSRQGEAAAFSNLAGAYYALGRYEKAIESYEQSLAICRVHFATHGLLDSERPGLSSLVLSMVDEQGKPQDGFLRANDIYNLKLPAELVVLSACPDRTWQRDQRRRTSRADAGVYVRGRGPCGRQSVERERQSYRRPDDEVLPEDAKAWRATGSGLTRRSGRDVASEAVAVAVLLGGVYHAGRMEVRCEDE